MDGEGREPGPEGDEREASAQGSRRLRGRRHAVSPQAFGSSPGRWLLLIYRVNSGSSSRRTYVWRQLRQLGAIYLQQAVAVLPDRPELRASLDQLGARIRSGGGEASVLETVSPSAAWEADLVARFNTARDAEYDEVVESVERFEDEIRRETRKHRFRFAELEESEADWAKLRRWFARLAERDFFGAEARASAEEAMARGRALLDGFTREVYRREGLDGEPPQPDAPA